ncbi:MAG: twin-arginine translocase subunit TatC, partial [Bdellovibrionaceae bacterium]|nr:twin-arginine translocase subunit TatC [Pseudobdellovibrionaceae bacterium]
FIVAGTILFLLGVAFVLHAGLPGRPLSTVRCWGNRDKPMITIDQYLGFFTLMTIMFGVAFELPLILVILALMGMFDANFLKKHRRMAIVILAVVAAVMSPPDAISMTMMWIPLVLLYESSIWVIHFLIKRPGVG